ncbi:MAG: GvpL/GvpF family gas vesicle protein [Gemmatimonadaceae bacterium]
MDQQRLSDDRMSALDASSPDEPASAEESAAGSGEEGKYVYCIIRHQAARDFGEIGIGGSARVYTVHHEDLAAVVSDTPIVIYDPTRDNVLAHEFVNETVMREFTVIPMSFGTVFRSEEDVGQLLRSTYEAFTDVLEKMKDKIEFGVQIRWDRERVVESIENDNDEIRKLKDEITRNASSSTYFARMQLGRLIEGALEESAGRYVATVHEELKRVSVASRSNKVIGDRMIMNAAFLVNRSDEKPFDEAVKELSRRFEHLLVFKYTGPWPPYNFVNIKLKLEKAD